MTAWPIRVACWINKATDTHSEHVTIITFPPQQCLHWSISVSRYMYFACAVISVPKTMLQHRTTFLFKHSEKKYNIFRIFRKKMTCLVCVFVCVYIYTHRVIHKSLRDFQPLWYGSWDGHAEGEHVNRGRDTPSFCPTLQVLDISTLLCLSCLLRGRVRKFRRDLWITLYKAPVRTAQ